MILYTNEVFIKSQSAKGVKTSSVNKNERTGANNILYLLSLLFYSSLIELKKKGNQFFFFF